MQGGCGQFDVAVAHDETAHVERCACRGAPLSQPHGQALDGSYEDYGILSRVQGFRIEVCAGLGIGIHCIVILTTPTSPMIDGQYRGR